jgi:hypothetical protein
MQKLWSDDRSMSNLRRGGERRIDLSMADDGVNVFPQLLLSIFPRASASVDAGARRESCRPRRRTATTLWSMSYPLLKTTRRDTRRAAVRQWEREIHPIPRPTGAAAVPNETAIWATADGVTLCTRSTLALSPRWLRRAPNGRQGTNAHELTRPCGAPVQTC